MTTLQFNSNISAICDRYGLNASLYYYIELNNPNWGEDWKNLKVAIRSSQIVSF
jgi:hypothetical protein